MYDAIEERSSQRREASSGKASVDVKWQGRTTSLNAHVGQAWEENDGKMTKSTLTKDVIIGQAAQDKSMELKLVFHIVSNSLMSMTSIFYYMETIVWNNTFYWSSSFTIFFSKINKCSFRSQKTGWSEFVVLHGQNIK